MNLQNGGLDLENFVDPPVCLVQKELRTSSKILDPQQYADCRSRKNSGPPAMCGSRKIVDLQQCVGTKKLWTCSNAQVSWTRCNLRVQRKLCTHMNVGFQKKLWTKQCAGPNKIEDPQQCASREEIVDLKQVMGPH